MEDAAGSRNLESQIHEIASREMAVNLPSIQWQTPDNNPNAKNVRIGILASAMKSDFVVVCSNIPYVDDIKVQFEKWSIDAKRRKDDAPDCIAQIWQHYRLLIKPKTVDPLKPNAPILKWEPELPPQALKNPEPDYRAEEANNADIEWMKTFTAGS
jgi:hypothetical protein